MYRVVSIARLNDAEDTAEAVETIDRIMDDSIFRRSFQRGFDLSEGKISLIVDFESAADMNLWSSSKTHISLEFQLPPYELLGTISYYVNEEQSRAHNGAASL